MLLAVIYHRYTDVSGHYTSYFLDHQQHQWFLADDARVSAHYNRTHAQYYHIQVKPVRVATVLQQDPFLLLYEICGKLESVS